MSLFSRRHRTRGAPRARSSRPRSRCAVARASSLRFTLSLAVAPPKSVSCSRSRVPVARAVSLSCARPDVRLPERRVGPRPPLRLRVASMRSLPGSVPRDWELARRDPVARSRVERVRLIGFPTDERAASRSGFPAREACTCSSCLRTSRSRCEAHPARLPQRAAHRGRRGSERF